MRSIVVDAPEVHILKLVRLAGEEGVSVRDLASRKFADLLAGIE
ncbi:ribbon-helix-helix DNA binding domain protein [Gordonia phage Catfish]|uniref:Ribbon-helix-helix DNA binding domain protein n=1 Tax=Gordonia phage Catfish TaxID=2301538 RepID=A0A385D0P6_9CAUD|nr:ribbon-helix-helix DNA binding domain protein [Gordonia phage Catfish]AXQ51906.1 ribbon-helix-helix DNA binding domain protein [Gordonia phage Catfish]